MKRSDKKGSHLGVILSFVLFVGFLFLLYMVMEPAINIDNRKEIYLEEVTQKILNRVSTNLTIVTNTILNSESCLAIPAGVGIGQDAIVKDKDEKIIKGIPNGGYINVNPAENDFIKIYFADTGFDDFPTSGTCISATEGTDYILESIYTKEYPFKAKFNSLVNSYNADYDGLKNEFGIPLENDFSFRIEYTDGSVQSVEGDESDFTVYVKEKQIQYVNQTANINTGTLLVKVW